MKKLIILYGKIGNELNGKQQMMIDGKSTCGYRSYAEKFGCIVYLCPQKVSLSWEFSIPDPNKVIEFIKQRPDHVVWSVKHDPIKDREILTKINNPKLYYSCCSRDMYNLNCDVSLVDTKERIRKNAKLWVKGKDPEYWKPEEQIKEFDYLLVGRRADKNELYFLRRLNEVKEKRRVLWIAGAEHQNKIKCNHEVVCTEFSGPDKVKKNIPKAKVGILFTDHPAEGFPQSLLEMTMCGLPVVYNKKGPNNPYYFFKENSVIVNEGNLIEEAEKLLKRYDSELCRKIAIENYSLEASYKKMLSLL